MYAWPATEQDPVNAAPERLALSARPVDKSVVLALVAKDVFTSVVLALSARPVVKSVVLALVAKEVFTSVVFAFKAKDAVTSVLLAFEPICVLTVVAKLGSFPNAAASSFRVFSVSGAAFTIEAVACCTKAVVAT
jgi:hypothetical protein